jgi:hypothetical protein
VVLAFHFQLELLDEPGEELLEEKRDGQIGGGLFAKSGEAFQFEDGGDGIHDGGGLGQIAQTEQGGVEGVESGAGQDPTALAVNNCFLEIGIVGFEWLHGKWMTGQFIGCGD